MSSSVLLLLCFFLFSIEKKEKNVTKHLIRYVNSLKRRTNETLCIDENYSEKSLVNIHHYTAKITNEIYFSNLRAFVCHANI